MIDSSNAASRSKQHKVRPFGTAPAARDPSVVFLVLILAAILTADSILLGTTRTIAALAAAAIYGIGGAILLLVTRGIRLQPIQLSIVLASAPAIAGAVLGVLNDLPFTAVMALGYLLAIGAVYFAFHSAYLGGRIMPRSEPSTKDFPTMVIDPQRVRGVDVFRYLNASQLDELCRIGRVMELHMGELLGAAGSPSHSLYVILEGRVELTASTPMGELTIRVAAHDEALPLATLLGDGKLITTAVALDDGLAWIIPRSELLEICGKRPDIGCQLFGRLLRSWASDTTVPCAALGRRRREFTSSLRFGLMFKVLC